MQARDRRPQGLQVVAVVTLILGCAVAQAKSPPQFAEVERHFCELPMEARRLTGPLFWLHGDESPEKLQSYLAKVAEGGNGCFTAESRPHVDWLGPGWYRDLRISLDTAKRHNLKMWIFDEKWWPSGEVGGKVPQQYASKYMEAKPLAIEGPKDIRVEIEDEAKLIAILAGKVDEAGIEGNSLIDLTTTAKDGAARWSVPAGRWQLMIFTWRYDEGRRGKFLVDGASQDAVDWYIKTVYQPHYDHFADDFGKTIQGYFYDEPETFGDWGTEVLPELKRRGADWKRALVAWKFALADPDEQIAAKYQYQDAFAETWGKTLYGGITEWCHKHNVRSIGHWLEHRREYLDRRKCAGNMFQVQKYSDMGGIDAVFRQFVPGRKDDNTYQTPKLGSSISHAYGKEDDLAMVEIFGARGQDLTYREMKWWTDHMHVSGINFHIPHAFNPRSPYDRDCPPYFYNSGFEPRWPLYRVYADYTSRLSVMLTGGQHVCPVAFLYLGNSFHVGKAITPENMTTALQDALFDCDWIPYDVFEQDMAVDGDGLTLRDERYRVLIVPAAEVIPYATLAKVKEFYDAGGVVVGYGMLPKKSATPGKTSRDIAALVTAVWGDAPSMQLACCGKNAAGGRAYFLPQRPSSADIQTVLSGDARIHPTLEVLDGITDDWLHVLHRVKDGRDVFFISNNQYEGLTKTFHLRAMAEGTPEVWDAMRGEICSLPHQRGESGCVDFRLTLEPLESVLVVFNPKQRAIPPRLEPGQKPMASLEVARLPDPSRQHQPLAKGESLLTDCPWVWHAADAAEIPACVRYFRGAVEIPEDGAVDDARFRLTADNDFDLYVNGKQVGGGTGGQEGWRRATTFDLKPYLQSGRNVTAIEAGNFNDQPNPAGLIGAYRIIFKDGTELVGRIDKAWKSSAEAATDWQTRNFDDQAWKPVKELAQYGDGPWGPFETQSRPITLPPVTQADPFRGRVSVPKFWLEGGRRIYVEATDIPHESATAVTVNGQYAGGFIGKPFRLDVTKQMKAGENAVSLTPFAPATVRLVAYPGVVK